GEGQLFLTAATVTPGADGKATFSIDVPAPPAGFDFITATATSTGLGTSNFSNALSASPTVRGFVFADANGNGTRDAGEGGLAGVTVYADANGNRQPDAAEAQGVSAADGSYQFAAPAGTYTVRAVRPAGLRRTTADPAAVTAAAGQL